MSSLQAMIMRILEQFAKSFKSVRPCGPDTVLYINGNKKFSVSYLISIDAFQVICKQPFRSVVGISEKELKNLFMQISETLS